MAPERQDLQSEQRPETAGPIVLFDAECVLCSANARFILEHDRRGHFRLASMQSAAGQRLYRANDMDPADPTSMIVVDGAKLRRDSDAALSIYEGLGYPWRLMGLFRLVPRPVRDAGYRLIARNRYRLFGKRDSCWVAPAIYRDRIL
ncbi:hypothetical protein BJF93_12920 [Xaviernesmea oryzae]|uniref:Thiol-disulfide oxidoreductase DCC family protein n=1 Tax=Xaviernesmea oryzae TaxID=464029 RepID=A0A1Q9ARJ0_9HYPH|nr:DCC1-like thiol-disulfide oxidoreductase family protein [Xaviernesmea oryzae]OLP57999.1 hypothetical protein BJF93_12920 [Xaviernesmea oryzae]SEM06950.1 Predicted thiol-disulfide oxidoreductase YuxK, DCC family [Xaviernesmea oryzae]